MGRAISSTSVASTSAGPPNPILDPFGDDKDFPDSEVVWKNARRIDNPYNGLYFQGEFLDVQSEILISKLRRDSRRGGERCDGRASGELVPHLSKQNDPLRKLPGPGDTLRTGSSTLQVRQTIRNKRQGISKQSAQGTNTVTCGRMRATGFYLF